MCNNDTLVSRGNLDAKAKLFTVSRNDTGSCTFSTCLAESTPSPSTNSNSVVAAHATNQIEGPVEARVKKEEEIPPNSFAIAFYKPTYVLPYYYTGSPDYAVYQNNTPGNERLMRSEAKYQLSFKVPIWKNIFNRHTMLNSGLYATLVLASIQSYCLLQRNRL